MDTAEWALLVSILALLAAIGSIGWQVHAFRQSGTVEDTRRP